MGFPWWETAAGSDRKGNDMMNETLKTIQTRYSCRSFTGEAIDAEKVEALALAAVQAPSGMNLQPWQIVVIKDKVLIDEMDAKAMELLAAQEDKSAYERMMSRGGKIYYNAPCMIVIAQKPGCGLDCGIACENVALAASALGLGNVICGMARMSLSEKDGGTYQSLVIPEGYEFGVAVLVGYATEENGTPHEPDLSKIRYIG